VKIAVDGFEVGEYATGVGRVTDNIMKSLIDLCPEHHFLIFTQEKIRPYSGDKVDQYVIPSKKGYFRWQNGPFLKKLKDIGPDILIAPNYTLPVFNRWKSILLEHDVSFVSHPEWFSKKEAIVRRFLVRRSLKKADIVVTVSEFSKNEIIKHFPVTPDKIRVFLYGVEESFQRGSQDQIEEWKERKGLKDKKIVGYLGSIFNRRNIPTLVEAVDLLRTEMPETILFLIGKDLTHPPQDINRLLNRDWIRWEKAIGDNELPFFYSALDAFAYLSEYEGFGLPPLEALACGTVPVLLNMSSLKEIYQDMAIFVEEKKAASVKNALKTAITDEKRKLLILNRFQEKKPQFSWKKTAAKFSLMIKNLAP